MNAIILAAGVGKRLGRELPKCLLDVGGRAVLHRMLDALAACGVGSATLVVGYRRDAIEEALATVPPSLPVTLVENARFREGAILSLHAARAVLSRGAVVMDADVVFDRRILGALLFAKAPSAILVDGSHGYTGEEMIVHGSRERVTNIHRGELPGVPALGEAVGFLKVSRTDGGRLAELLDAAVGAGRTGIEHEEVYDELFAERTVAAVATAGRAWTEIDFAEDVRRAVEVVLPAIEAAR